MALRAPKAERAAEIESFAEEKRSGEEEKAALLGHEHEKEDDGDEDDETGQRTLPTG